MTEQSQQIPNDEQSEKAVLGAVMLDNRVMAEAQGGLSPEAFYWPKNRTTFVAMLALFDSGVEINPVTLSTQLRETGSGVDFMYLSQLTQGIPTFKSIRPYVSTLREKWLLRRCVQLGQAITDRAADGESIGELTAWIEETAAEIRAQAGDTGSAFRSFAEVAEEAKDYYTRLHKGESRAIPTGFKELDSATRGGAQPGDVWVIGALTGRGKSAWAIGAARQQAQLGIPSAIVSREMADLENFSRAHSPIANVPAWRIRPGIWDEDFQKLMDTADTVGSLPIYINSKTPNVFDIRSQVKELVRNKGVRSLFVDYVQLMGVTMETRNATRAQEVATVSRVLKEIAMENEIAVFTLAQFNRGANGTDKPDIHQFADSSGIEKDASVVLVLDMEEQKEYSSIRKCTMRIAKHRQGPQLSLAYNYDGSTLTFKPVESEESTEW